MKVKLELNLLEDGRKFLNFWDSIQGNDVVAEVKDGKLYVCNELVSLSEYIEKVRESLNKRQEQL
jgi:hypothetical protein